MSANLKLEGAFRELEAFSCSVSRDLTGAGFDNIYLADYKGFGIGMAIVQHIVKRHGEKLLAASEPGKDAAFYFALKP